MFLFLLLLLLFSSSSWQPASCLPGLEDESNNNYEDEVEPQQPQQPSSSVNPKLATGARRWPFFGLVGFMFLGASGNILVCMAVWRERRLQTATNYFLLSLAVADLLVCTLVMPFGIINEFYGHWPFDWRICNLWVTCDVLTCSSSILHMCFISVGRYLGIRNPLHARQANLFVSRRAVLWRIAIAWFSSALIASPLTMMSVFEETTSECSITNKYFLIFGSMLAFFIPMFVMVASYIMTVRLLSRRAKFVRNNSLLLTNTTTNSSVQQQTNNTALLSTTTNNQPNHQPSASSPITIPKSHRLLDHKDVSTSSTSSAHQNGSKLANAPDRTTVIQDSMAASVKKFIDDPQEAIVDAASLAKQYEKKEESSEMQTSKHKAQSQDCQDYNQKRSHHSYCCCERRRRHHIQTSIIPSSEKQLNSASFSNIQQPKVLKLHNPTVVETSSLSPSFRCYRCCPCDHLKGEKTKSLVGMKEEEVVKTNEILTSNMNTGKSRLLKRPRSVLSPEALIWEPLGGNPSSDSSSLTCYSLDTNWAAEQRQQQRQQQHHGKGGSKRLASLEVNERSSRLSPSPTLMMMKKLRGNDGQDHKDKQNTSKTRILVDNSTTTTALLSTWPTQVVQLNDKLSPNYQEEEKRIVRLSSSNTTLDPPSLGSTRDTQESSKLSPTSFHSVILKRLEISSCAQLRYHHHHSHRQEDDDDADQDEERLSSMVSFVIEPEEEGEKKEEKENPKENGNNQGNYTQGIQGESSDLNRVEKKSGCHSDCGSDFSMLNKYLCAAAPHNQQSTQHRGMRHKQQQQQQQQHRMNHAYSSATSCPEGLESSEQPTERLLHQNHRHSHSHSHSHEHHHRHHRHHHCHHHYHHCRLHQRHKNHKSHKSHDQQLHLKLHLARKEIAFTGTELAPSVVEVGVPVMADDDVPRVERDEEEKHASTVAASSSLLVAAALPVIGLSPASQQPEEERYTLNGMNKRGASARVREKSQSSSSSGNGIGQSSGIQLNFSSADTGNEPQMIRYLGSSMQVRSEQKATKVLGLVFSTFIFCWAPFFVINFAQGFVDRRELSRWVTNEMMVTFLWLGYISSTINPVIYTVFNRNFRQAFRQLLLCRPASNQFGGRYSREPDLNRVFRFTSQYRPSNRLPAKGNNGTALFTSSLYRAPPSATLQARHEASQTCQQTAKASGFLGDENSTLLIMDDNQSPSNQPPPVNADTLKAINSSRQEDEVEKAPWMSKSDELDSSKCHKEENQQPSRKNKSISQNSCNQTVRSISYETNEASENHQYCHKHHHRKHLHCGRHHHHHHYHHHRHHRHHCQHHSHGRQHEKMNDFHQPATKSPAQNVKVDSNLDKLAPVKMKLSLLDQNGNNQLIQDK